MSYLVTHGNTQKKVNKLQNCSFIHTTDLSTVEKLFDLGFNLITSANGVYTFENKPSLAFDLSKFEGLRYVKNNRLTF